MFYSSFLSLGKDVEWEVSILDWSGNESIYFDAYIHDTKLSQGDSVILKVIRNPNTLPIDFKAEGEWLNITLNGQESQYNTSDIHLGAHTWLYGDFFISPVIDEIEDNPTHLFKKYYDHMKPTEYNITEAYTDIGTMYSIQLVNTEYLIFNLTDNLFKETFYYSEYFNTVDNRYEGEEESLFKQYRVLYESVIDIERGTLFSYRCYIDYVYNYTSVLEENELTEDHYNLLIENNDKTTGYAKDFIPPNPAESYEIVLGVNINYIIFGMAIFTAVFAFAQSVYEQRTAQKLKHAEKRQITGFTEEIKKIVQPQGNQRKKDKEKLSLAESTNSSLSK